MLELLLIRSTRGSELVAVGYFLLSMQYDIRIFIMVEPYRVSRPLDVLIFRLFTPQVGVRVVVYADDCDNGMNHTTRPR